MKKTSLLPILVGIALGGITLGSPGLNNSATAQRVEGGIPRVGEKMPRFNEGLGLSMGWRINGVRPRSGWLTFYENGEEQSLTCGDDEVIFYAHDKDRNLSFVDYKTVTMGGIEKQIPDGRIDKISVGILSISPVEGPYSFLIEDVPYCPGEII